MKQVFIAGGSGRVATELIRYLVASGYAVVAGARHPERVVQLTGVSAVKMDLHDGVDQLAQLMHGSLAVYFTAGSRGKDLLQTDAMGAVKTMQAAETAGIKRYVMLSSMYALQPAKWSQYPALANITDYNIAKFFADRYLIDNTQLDYTIIQPATLTEKPATGKVTLGEGDDTTNPIPDVARVLADVLPLKPAYGQVIMMRSGQTPIGQALEQL